ETTVTATWAEMAPDRPVTIGRPLPSHTVHLLDGGLDPVPEGAAGEICIGGPCVAVGYVNRPDLTAEKFIDDPFSDSPGARLYRSGDLGRLTTGGEIEFLGRIDSQVKVRGFRIELGEIEAVLRENPAVTNALVALVETGGGQELAAYLTLCGPAADEVLRARLHAALRHRLPPYMVPAYVEVLDAIPTLPSGKADRARLPAPTSPRLAAPTGGGAPPETPLERAVAAAWGKAFGHPVTSVDADFFLDLGGHSLLAAGVISELRRDPTLHDLGIGDLYTHPTVRGLARYAERPAARPPAAVARPAARRHGSMRVWACGAVQAALFYLALAVFGVPAILVLSADRASPVALAGGAAAALAATLGLSLVLPVVAKWLLIGRFRPGRYPLWGWYYCRWWLVRKLQGLAPANYLAGSPLFAPYLRLLGARVGRGCHLGSAALQLPDLLEIGDGASVGYGAVLEPFSVEGGWFIQAPVRVGAGAFVGANAVVLPGASIGTGACLAEQSLLARDQAIPAGETWAGSPSGRVAPDAKLGDMAASTGPDRWSAPLLAGFALGFLGLEVLPALLLLPGLLVLYAAPPAGWWWPLLLTPAAGLVYVLTTCAVVALGKRLVIPSVRPGVVPLRSGFGLRKWLSDKLMMTSLAATNALYATLYALPWLRLLGARVGPRAEVSTVANVDPNLLVLGAESFVADSAVVGAARYHNGQIALGVTELGRRCFVGNASLVPAGDRLAPGSLLGVLSVPPAGPVGAGTSWLGSPAIFLPRRQTGERFDEGVTFRPAQRLVACRLAVEFFRVVLPPTLTYALVPLCGAAEDGLAAWLPAAAVAALLPATYFGGALLIVGVVAVLKWLVVGRYRPRVVPLWSHFVWRTELITALYESAAVPWLLRWWTGTPWLPALLRLFGAHFGQRVYLETTSLTEFDLVRVGDDAEVGGLTLLQTHLFEDRVMKMSAVVLGAGCTVGPRSVVLYGAEVGVGAELDALSLVMKGETLPAETRWRGIPARPAG
ncbi:MAG TPA: Pls/PosA family non-ribosomal peptide synthetase, partial [Gemmataceae bacterium]